MVKRIKCFGKEYKSIQSLANEYNINSKIIYSRLHRGYSIEEAVSITKEQTNKTSINNLLHIKLNKNDVIKRMKKCGYTIINYTYKNNQTRMLCYDSNNYKVYMCLAGAETGAKAQIFSVTHNADNFLYNINLYCKYNNYKNKALDWRIGNNNKQPEVLFECKCGRTFWRNFNLWKNKQYGLCPHCSKTTSFYEKKVKSFLTENNIKFVLQKRFKECKNIKTLPFDFYIPQYNCCIEVDGEQHFDKERIFSRATDKDKEFDLRLKLDNIKTEYCKNNNIKLLRIPYWEFDKEETYKKSIINILNI